MMPNLLQKILIVCSCLLLTTCLYAQHSKTDSLEQALQHCTDNQEKVNTLNRLSEAYWRTESETAKVYGLDAQSLSKAIDYPFGLAESHFNLGRVYNIQGNYDESLASFLEALHIFQTLEDTKGIAKSLSNIGIIYSIKGNDTLSLSFQLQALQLFQTLPNEQRGVANCYNNIGYIYGVQKNLDKAQEYYFKALKIAEEIQDSLQIAFELNNIATGYEEEGRNGLALMYYQKSKSICEKIGDKQGVAYGYLGIGAVQFQTQSYEAALVNYQEAQSIFEELGAQNDMAYLYNEMAKVYQAIGQSDKAKVYVERSLAIANSIGALEVMMDGYQSLTEIARTLKDYKTALEAQSQYLTYKDSIFHEERLSTIGNLETTFLLQQKEAENKLLAANISQKRLVNMVLGIVVGFILVLSLVLYRVAAQTRKKNELLKKQNHEIEAHQSSMKVQADELASKNATLTQMSELLAAKNKELSKFASIASHDMKEPLRIITSFSQILERKHKQEAESMEFIHFIKDASTRMTRLLDDLITFARAGIQTQAATKVDLNEVLFAAKANLKLKLEQSGASIVSDNLPIIEAHFTPIVQVFQNVLDNGLKFQQMGRQPNILICTSTTSKHHVISFSDNGIGIEADYLSEIFEPFKRLHTKAEYAGSGIGLATCKKIMERYEGKINVQSKQGVGTTFYIYFPKIEKDISQVEVRQELVMSNN